MSQELTSDQPAIGLAEQVELQELIGNPPGWLLRSGISLILIFVLSFGILTWIIRYPEIISAPLMLSTESPVIRVVAKTSGKLELLLVENQDCVERNQVIGIIESTANWTDVKRLKSKMDILAGAEIAKSSLPAPETLSLGELQMDYNQLFQETNELTFFLENKGLEEKQKAILLQIELQEKLWTNLEKQLSLFSEELVIIEKNLKISKELYATGASNLLEVENDESRFLQYKRQREAMRAQQIVIETTIGQFNSQLVEMERELRVGVQNRITSIEKIIGTIISSIQNWEEKYLIKAPIDGELSMNIIRSQQQYVQAGSEVFTIVPFEGTGKVIAYAYLPPDGIGKIHIGCKAHVILDGYPPSEFGVIKAELENIALLPENKGEEGKSYLLEFDLTDGMNTTYQQSLPLRQEMPGKVEIITDDKRILIRILERFLNLL